MNKRSKQNSRWGYRLLSIVLGRGEHFTMIGDLEEIYAEMIKEKGGFRANLWYWGQIFRSVPSFLSHFIYWSGVMIKNYVLTSLRNFKKQKVYTFINVFGLAIGLAACLLAVLYIRDELSYDRYNEKAERIYRMVAWVTREGNEVNIIGAGAPAAPALIEGYPEVEDGVRFREEGSIRVKAGETSFRETRVVYSEPSFFNVFTVPLLKGNPQTALASPKNLVLSRTTASKYFGMEDPLGKTLLVDDDVWTVTGVFKDIPRASHFHFDIILSLSSLDTSQDPFMMSWMSFNFQTYLLLREGASPQDLKDKLYPLIHTHMAPEIQQGLGISLDEWLAKSQMKIDYGLQALTDIHLRSNATVAEFEPNSDIKYITLFSAVSLFILILAVINFVNLATARSSGRAKEVGLRKVLGSFRRGLIGQFLLESTILSLTALVFAIFLSGLVLPLFNQLSGKNFSLFSLAQPGMLVSAIILTLAIGALAGIYPAFFISGFRPTPILRGDPAIGIKRGHLRRVLVVFQFAVSVVMIIGTLVVFRQLHFIQNSKIGFNKDQVLLLRNTTLLGDRAETLKQEMLNYPGVVKASLSGFLPIPSSRARMPVAREGDPDAKNALPISVWTVDHDYIDTLEMTVAEGRNFSREFPTDTTSIIINMTAVHYFGFETPVGQRLVILDFNPQTGGIRSGQPLTVIGVLEDFHYESLRERIAPLVMRLGTSRGMLALRVRTDEIPGTLESLKKKWTEMLPGEPFEYSFLDESFNRMYEGELRIGRIFGTFAGLAVFIGCLGLFGLAAFSAVKRMKEIGIHKVFGASVPDIVKLLIREFMILVGIANVIAWPVAHVLMSNWLRQFAYRASITWMMFAATGVMTFIIALMTVGVQSFKAAAASPAKILKYE